MAFLPHAAIRCGHQAPPIIGAILVGIRRMRGRLDMGRVRHLVSGKACRILVNPVALGRNATPPISQNARFGGLEARPPAAARIVVAARRGVLAAPSPPRHLETRLRARRIMLEFPGFSQPGQGRRPDSNVRHRRIDARTPMARGRPPIKVRTIAEAPRKLPRPGRPFFRLALPPPKRPRPGGTPD